MDAERWHAQTATLRQAQRFWRSVVFAAGYIALMWLEVILTPM